MANLKDTIINGSLRVTGKVYADDLEGTISEATTVNGHTVNSDVPANAKFTDTTYTGSNGVSISGTTISNSGVRSIATGSTNGTISVNTNGTAADVSVKGLGAMAYKASAAASDITSGTLGVARGGTGASTLTSGQVLIGNGTGAVTTKAIDTTSGGTADSTSLITSGAVKAGLNTKLNTSLKGAASGLAELDANGKVPSSQLPSYVDDVLEYDKQSSFPSTGETGKIYIAQDTNKTYRWSGSAYAEISASLALGTTSSTAYRGDYGNTAYTHATDANRLTTAKSEGLYKIATTAHGHVKSVTAVTKSDITGLGIPAQDTTYSDATTSTHGLMSTADKTKLNATNIVYATSSTTAATAAKEATISGNDNWTLQTGAIVVVKFSATNTANNPTLNVNSTGAKSIWYNTGLITTGNKEKAGQANRPIMYMYDGTQYVFLGWAIDANDNTNTIPAAYCSTAADTAAKTASHTDYILLAKSYELVTIKTANSVQGAITLNINSKGAKPIYINGTASSSSNYTLPAGTYLVYYDGTNYYFRTDGKITGSITGDAATVGGHTVATDVPSGAKFTDTTYENKTAASGGTDVSLVTTGEKYTWNNKSSLAIGTTSTTAAAGTHTHSASLATDTGTSAITLAHGGKYKLTAGGSSVIFTMPSDNNTDTKVTINNSTTNANYRLMLGATADDTNHTETAVKSTNFYANPNTGAFYAKGYQRIDITSQTVNLNDLTLSAGTVDSMYYKQKTDGGANNITNIPVTGKPFLLDVELIRWASTTDYITRQTFRNANNPTNEYVRFCTNGTWGSWTTRVFTDNNTTYTFATGDNNGQIKVTPSSGSATNISVKGLGSAAYTDSTAYASSSHTHNYAGSSSAGGAATSSLYPNITNSNEIRFLVSTKPSSASTLYIGYKWSDGTSDAKITEYRFCKGDTNLAGIKASTVNDYILAAACAKAVDTSISAASTSTNLPTSAAVASFVEGKGYKTTDNDTKNTAGSTDSSSKLFLIGATSQAANPQTYSQDTAYVGTDGHLYSNSKKVVNLSDSQALTNKTYNGYTLAAACAKGVDTSMTISSTSTNVPTTKAVADMVSSELGDITTLMAAL